MPPACCRQGVVASILRVHQRCLRRAAPERLHGAIARGNQVQIGLAKDLQYLCTPRDVPFFGEGRAGAVRRIGVGGAL